MERKISGEGSVRLELGREALWDALLDPDVLMGLMPGAASVRKPEADRFIAKVAFGVGRFRSDYAVDIVVGSQDRPGVIELSGTSSGALGRGRASARVELVEVGPDRCEVSWGYEGTVSGTVALAGTALLNVAAQRFVAQFFERLSRMPEGQSRP